MTGLISPTEADAITGKWNYQSLPDNVRLGSECFIERQASFKRFRSVKAEGLRLGNRVFVYTWTEFNVEPTGFLQVGDDTILVGAVFMCADRIVIGSRVVISYNVTIADSDFHPIDPEQRKLDAISNAPFANRAHRPLLKTAPVEIGDDVKIGVGAIILKGVRIGSGATVHAGAVVSRDIPSGTVVCGNPAAPVNMPSARLRL